VALLNSGCTSVTVHDEQFWGIKGALGATGVHTQTSQVTHVDKPTWDAMSVGMIAESAGTFGDVKLAFEQLCEMVGPSCTVDVQQQAAKMFSNIAVANGGPLRPNMTLPLLKAVQRAKKAVRPK
jgi:hypothetical protein